MDIQLAQDLWDCCVIGNGVSAFWLSHWLWNSKRSVLWVSSEEPYQPQRAFLQRAWPWAISKALVHHFEIEQEYQPAEFIYFDAKSARCFHQLSEVSPTWGEHEKGYFEWFQSFVKGKELLDLWPWHAKFSSFYQGEPTNLRTMTEFFRSPRFVHLQGHPVIECRVKDDLLTHFIVGGFSLSDVLKVSAREFFIGDYRFHPKTEMLFSPKRVQVFQSGFGLRFLHRSLQIVPMQTMILPLFVNSSESSNNSHVVGRFYKTHDLLESVWFGFLNDQECEDNNEILKKIKQTKRAIERAIPGFFDNVSRESVNMEPRMWTPKHFKHENSKEVFGAKLVTDYGGLDHAVSTILSLSQRGSHA